MAVLAPICSESWAIAVYAKAGSKELPFSEVKAELVALLEEAGIS